MLKLPQSNSRRRLTLTQRVVREILIWTFTLTAAFAVTWYALYPAQPALAADSPLSSSGAVFYGDTTNVGILRARLFTTTATWAAEINGITGSASAIEHVVAKTAPTREEIMIGSLRINGTLQIETCTAACDANADYTNRWAHASVSATQDCDTAPTTGTCIQPFDIGYMSLSGKAMVVYAGDGADAGTTTDSDLVYYAIWDGSAWSPDSSPDTPSSTNQIDLPGTAGTPRWVRVIPDGVKFDQMRSDRMIVLVDDSNSDLHAFYWNGTSFDSGSTLETAMQNDDRGRPFDGGWGFSTVGNSGFMVAYTDTAANAVRYQSYTVGTGWSGESTMANTSAAGYWVTADTEPLGVRVYFVTADQGENTEGYVATSTISTNVCAAGGCPDASTEGVTGNQAAIGLPRTTAYNGVHAFGNAGNNINSQQYMKITSGSTWGAAATLGFTTTSDDGEKIKAWGNPNNDDVMVIGEDVDCNMFAVQYNGTTLDAVNDNLETDLSDVPATCNQASPTTEGVGAGFPYDFAWKQHEPWQRNWQFFSDADTASSPTTSLAAENTSPTNFSNSGGGFRLRINYAERGRSISSTDDRKRLQYATGCDPITNLESTCSWQDVGDAGSGSAWRFKDLACTPTDCADNTTLTATKLSGSSTCSAGLGCGTWVEQGSGGTVTNMDLTAQSGADTIQESEWIVESNNTIGASRYYFRIYDVNLDTAIFREQDSNDCGAGGASQCTYPSILTAPTVVNYMRHGNYFIDGVEQNFSWAD